MNFRRVLETVGKFLTDRGYRYALAGAFAMHGYGLSRATSDLDVVVEARGQKELIDFLESLGYETLYVSAGYSNHLHSLPALGRIDCIYVEEPTSEQLFEGTREVGLVGGISFRAVRPEHLCAMKVLAMRNDPSRALQEMADIQRLLELSGVNEDEVRGYFYRYGLQEAFDEIKRRIESSRSGKSHPHH